ncbi:MAG: sulfotransferase family protein [Gammaproteobacteria bacterium]
MVSESDNPDTTYRQRAVLIIGAGRSGTSAVAHGVQVLGVDLGDHFKRATRKNPTGFFEDAELLDLSKRVRRKLGLRADSVALIDASAWQQPGIATLQERAGKIIQRRFMHSPIWGFKYGRTLSILPFWQAVFAELGIEPSFVIATRNPLSVARSRARLDTRRGTQEKSDLEWLVSIVPYFRQLRGQRFMVIDYDLLMQEPQAQLRRLARQLQLPHDAQTEQAVQDYARHFLASDLRHSHFNNEDLGRDLHLNVLTRDAYRWLYRLAADELTADNEMMWQDWQRIEEALMAMAPVLSHIDRVEAEFRRARWNPLSFIAAVHQLWRYYRHH